MTDRPIPFFDRARTDAALEPELVDAFLGVLRSGRYILGPEVEAFEAECAAALGVPHAVGVSSGTDALLIALLALGIGPGDEVICPAYTFFATAGVIARAGAAPVFADVLPGPLTLDPASLARAITPRTKAIVAVHLFGQCASMDDLLALASPRGLPILEDAAQAFGATCSASAGSGCRRAGALGTLGCFSFFPTKNLGGFGDGGLVTTADPRLADRVRLLRAQGARPKLHHLAIGGNFRLDALQAALLRRVLPHVGEAITRRRAHAARYDALLGEADLPIAMPFRDGPGHTFNQYVIRLHAPDLRDPLRRFLADRGIATEVYYPAPLHLQPCFADPGRPPLPVAEAAASTTLALPIYPDLLPGDLDRIAAQIRAFFASARK